jgi:hypothetical protein
MDKNEVPEQRTARAEIWLAPDRPGGCLRSATSELESQIEDERFSRDD